MLVATVYLHLAIYIYIYVLVYLVGMHAWMQYMPHMPQSKIIYDSYWILPYVLIS